MENLNNKINNYQCGLFDDLLDKQIKAEPTGFKRVLSFNKPFALLMSVLYLNDGTPYKLFKDIDLQLLLFGKRMTFKRQSKSKINFMSCYFCRDFLPKQIIFTDFKNQKSLFEGFT